MLEARVDRGVLVLDARLVEEAGGICTNWDGEPYALGEPGLIAANQAIHRSLRSLVRPERF